MSATWAAFMPGLSGPFIFDDVHYVVKNERIRMTQLNADTLVDAFYSANTWYPRRGITRLSFGVDYFLAGGYQRFAFKSTNLIIHLLNGALVFALLYRLLRRRFAAVPICDPIPRVAIQPSPPTRISSLIRLWPMMSWQWMAVIATGIWLLHPIQLTAVLYVTQRFTEMSALLCASGTIVVCVRARARRTRRA